MLKWRNRKTANTLKTGQTPLKKAIGKNTPLKTKSGPRNPKCMCAYVATRYQVMFPQ